MTSLTDRAFDFAAHWRSRLFGDPEVPTLMHITHAKAGSTWINNLLRELFRSRVAPRGKLVAANEDLSKHVFEPGRVYPAMFLRREQFMAHPELHDCRRFIIIRDLRDTLVSLYFSLKISHPEDAQGQTRKHRLRLQELDLENGLLYLLREQLPGAAAMQSSWIGHDEMILRYEDLLEDGFERLREVFIDRLALPISESALARAFRRTHFENVYKRKLGDEDVTSHGRKGVPGDWRNHFTSEVRRQFAEMFGSLLIDAGYETNNRWAG